MHLLLDTHAAVWAVSEPHRIPGDIQRLILDENNDIFVSAVAVWEIAIKVPLARASAPPITATAAIEEFDRAGYRMLAITGAHAAAVADLPPLHSDPFDRLLVAQALLEPMRLVTHDRTLARYSDTVISW